MKKILFLNLLCFFTLYDICISAVHTGADFLKLGGGARIIALADTSAATDLDGSSFFHNPAGFTKTDNEITFVHAPSPFGDAYFQYLGGIYSIPGLASLAAGIFSYRIEPITVTDETNNEFDEKLIWNDWAFAFAAARDINRRISLGVCGKYIYRYERNPIFGKTVGTAFSFDLGIKYRVVEVEGLALGISLENYGTDVKYSNDPKIDVLPASIRLGAVYRVFETKENRFDVACDFFKETEDKFRPRISGEYTYLDWLSLRGGFLNKAGNISGVNFGFGIEWRGYCFDFASAVSSVFDRTAYMTVSKKFY